jgi:hypothetical protein
MFDLTIPIGKLHDLNNPTKNHPKFKQIKIKFKSTMGGVWSGLCLLEKK